MLKFAANLYFLFSGETSSMVDRVKLAADAGFKGVEIPFPYEISPSILSSAKESNGVEVVLMNSWLGDVSSGEFGVGIFPGRRDEFREKLELSVTYLKALDCRRLHIMSGMTPTTNDISAAELEETFLSNLRYAADRLEREGVMTLIEPLNSHSHPGYWLSDPAEAQRIVRQVAHPNLKLQLDIFHAQMSGGDLSHRIKDWAADIGHVQIAQVPRRTVPDSRGELDYQYVLQHLVDCGYTGWVGLEYWSSTSTVDSLQWLRDWGYWPQ